MAENSCYNTFRSGLKARKHCNKQDFVECRWSSDGKQTWILSFTQLNWAQAWALSHIESLICILDLAIILDNLQPIVHMYTYYSYSLGAQRWDDDGLEVKWVTLSTSQQTSILNICDHMHGNAFSSREAFWSNWE